MVAVYETADLEAKAAADLERQHKIEDQMNTAWEDASKDAEMYGTYVTQLTDRIA